MKALFFNRGDAKEVPAKKDLGGWVQVILTTLLIFLASQLLAAFVVEAGLAIMRGSPSQSALTDSIAAQFIFVFLAEGMAAWLTIILVRRRGLNLGFIGLGRRPVLDDLFKALAGAGVFYVLLITAGIILNALSPDLNSQKQNIGFDNINSQTDNILAFISLVILPPLGEEVLMRGYLYSGLRKIWKFVPALLVTSLVFGAAHLELGNGTPLVWAAALDTFLLSMVLVYLREKTGALYAGILVHMTNNLIAFLIIIK